MAETACGRTVLDTLTRHFFWRFFQTENVGEGDASETPVVRALAVVAVPMLMAAFWIVTLAGRMSVWQRAGVHSLLFVVYAFCSMGCVTALQWEKLFPERIGLPDPAADAVAALGILFLAKLRAVAAFLLLFVVAGSLSGTVLLPAIAGGSRFRGAASAWRCDDVERAPWLAWSVLTLEATVDRGDAGCAGSGTLLPLCRRCWWHFSC